MNRRNRANQGETAMAQLDSVRKSVNFERVLEETVTQLKAAEPAFDFMGAEGVAERIAGTGGTGLDDIAERVLTGGTAGGEEAFFQGPRANVEAIILERLRPPYFIKDDRIEIMGDYDHVDMIEANKAMLEARSRSVGRVDLLHHASYQFVGTGWLIEKDIVVTNRHVAEVFAESDWSGAYRFKPGIDSQPVEAMMDYVRQHQSSLMPRRAFATEVIYIASANEPDFAFIRVQATDAEPLALTHRRAEVDQPIAVVGYPASDGGRNDPELMARLFGGVYNVKRFAPGLITGLDENSVILRADYTSLGGNSGSAVLDLATGDVVGLHFAGVFRDTNYAVAADIVGAALARTRVRASASGIEAAVAAGGEEGAPINAADHFDGRRGYAADFLGSGERLVPLPRLNGWANDVAPVAGAADGILHYEHFSVIQSKSRRLPLVTAVNIDGEKQRKLDRQGDWKLDARLALADQIGNELYANNRLDRGHMVRRRDPGWGEPAEAARGEADTFHYTNSVPQHQDLNQKDWVRLEDYLLGAAETLGFRASVFTGPVFRTTDKRLRRQPGAEDVQIPEEFWKVAVMINADTGQLHATAYVLTHGPLIRDMTEAAFVFGQHDSYQVPITLVEEATGLDFGALRTFDPMSVAVATEGPTANRARRIGGPADLML